MSTINSNLFYSLQRGEVAFHTGSGVVELKTQSIELLLSGIYPNSHSKCHDELIRGKEKFLFKDTSV